MLIKPYLIHALSPLHAGTGQSVDVIDLPIARTRATGIPFLPGSSLKGVLRERCRAPDEREESEASKAVFGPDHTEADKHAGAFAVTDARLLALPVRSFRGAFAWVSSPLLLALARRDLAAATRTKGQPEVTLPAVALPKEPAARVSSPSRVMHEDSKVYLEDLDLPAKVDGAVQAWATWLQRLVAPGTDMFTGRLVVVDDDTMSFLLETATQIDARVRIDGETGTVAQGALWYEESLPAETLLLGLAMADRSRHPTLELSGEQVLRHALPGELAVQLGGKASVGRGRCRVMVIEGEVRS
jgi:CRISPR-associated protein Cmr4